MPDDPRTELRSVESADPSLSAEANARLTGELREAVGRDTVLVPRDRPDPAHAAHAGYGPTVFDTAKSRMFLAYLGYMLVLVAVVAALAFDLPASVPVATAILIAATAFTAARLFWVTDETERPSPETSALLEDEGIEDPDRLMTDLVREFTPPR